MKRLALIAFFIALGALVPTSASAAHLGYLQIAPAAGYQPSTGTSIYFNNTMLGKPFSGADDKLYDVFKPVDNNNNQIATAPEVISRWTLNFSKIESFELTPAPANYGSSVASATSLANGSVVVLRTFDRLSNDNFVPSYCSIETYSATGVLTHTVNGCVGDRLVSSPVGFGVVGNGSRLYDNSGTQTADCSASFEAAQTQYGTMFDVALLSDGSVVTLLGNSSGGFHLAFFDTSCSLTRAVVPTGFPHANPLTYLGYGYSLLIGDNDSIWMKAQASDTAIVAVYDVLGNRLNEPYFGTQDTLYMYGGSAGFQAFNILIGNSRLFGNGTEYGLVASPEVDFTKTPVDYSPAPADFEWTTTVHGVDQPESVECRYDSNAFEDCSANSARVSNVAVGLHQFDVRVCDNYGDTTDCTTESYSWHVTSANPPQPPTVLIANPNDSTDTSVSIPFAHGGGTATSVRCTLDNGVSQSCTNPASYSGLSVGSHTVVVEACNAAGCGSDSTTWAVTKPVLMPPTVDITNAPQDGSSVNVRLEYVLGGGAADSTVCILDGGTPQACGSPMTYQGVSKGAHTITVESCNASGCGSDSTSWTVTPQLEKPTVRIVDAPPTDRPITGGTESVSFVTDGTIDSTRCQLISTVTKNGATLTDSSIVECGSPQTYNTPDDGIYTFSVEVCNRAGCSTNSTPWTVLNPPTNIGDPIDPTPDPNVCVKPSLTRVSSTKLGKGDRIEVTGTGLGAKTNAFVGKTALDIESRSPTVLVASVPEGAKTGTLSLRCDELTTETTVRITIITARLAPVAQGLPTETKPRVFALDGTLSYDQNPSGRIVKYRWTERGKKLSSKATFSNRFAPGKHKLTLKVTNQYGLSDSTTVSFTASKSKKKTPPTVIRITLPNTLFCFDCDTLSKKAASILKKARTYTKGAKSLTIEGHTDSVGSDAYNKALSQRRAETVKKALLSKLSPRPKKVRTIGFGESRPAASNATPAGRAKNRRVELTIRR